MHERLMKYAVAAMRFTLVAGLVTGGVLTLDQPAWAQDPNNQLRTITVRGEARASVPPDQATVTFSVETRSKDPNLARSLNADASTRAIKAVEKAGVPSKAIRLQNLILRPAREWNQDTRKYDDLGYDVTRTVEVRIENLELVADVIVGVVESGANRLDGVHYGLKSDTDVRTAVLADAVVSARTRAEAMAAALGAQIGEVLVVKEEGVAPPQPYFREEAMMLQKAAGDESQAVPAGDIEVSASVVVTFSLSQNDGMEP